MPRTTAVIIGAGHCGLAMSRHLAERSIDHVFLERGEVANSWRTERWDSLRLLTPNWLTRLPGHAYDGPDPDGYMTAGEVAGFIQATPTPRRRRCGPTRRSSPWRPPPTAAIACGPTTANGSPTPSWWHRAPATWRRCPPWPSRC